ncbi:head GIN domain-containing protein [Pedobacter insulae]|uniref:Putative auto-transporter adhesin, head GIN domain n=1 Tax=Pedobacter insulae TaxID=414048 RepID=A0A1I2ZCX7_9SPHI|nr:head GIN domain-containing protein [Pedobacter insulae]SFH35712.1 Putative auto-transporter adhesin, head GIN domain [Pedobacter insulae]
MKTKFLSLSLILAIFSVNFIPASASNPKAPGLYKIKEDERAVKNFNGIAAGGPIHVIVTLGNTEGLRFEGDADAIATLVTEVKGNVLIIRPQNSWTSWARKYANKKITAYVSAKTIRSLTMSGNGSMTVNGKIKEEALTATLSGSGSISATADIENFNGVISGSGNLNFTGGADAASIVISGSGSFTKKGFSVGNLSAVISGSGSVNVNASHKIEAVISGSGSVYYSGNAQVEKRVNGSGSVRKI